MRAHYWFSSTLCAAIGVLGACTSSPTGLSEKERPELPEPVSLVLLVAPSQATIRSGQTLQLSANPRDAGSSFAPAAVEWASSNTKVARIGTDGTVVGGGPGTAQITAAWHGMQGAATVSVVGDAPAQGPCPNLAIVALKTAPSVPSDCGVR
jgi:hypothetical protein